MQREEREEAALGRAVEERVHAPRIRPQVLLLGRDAFEYRGFVGSGSGLSTHT